MANTAAKVKPLGLIHKHNRSTYRTPTDTGYEAFSAINCGCVRVIDLDVQVNKDFQSDVWILVFDTTLDNPNKLSVGAVPYLPAKKVSPGEHATAAIRSEWIPFNVGILVCASADQILDLTGIDNTVISTYVRYELEGAC